MRKYAKAIVSAVGAGLGSLGLALSDGDLTRKETLIAAGVSCVTLAAVWRIPNQTPTTQAGPRGGAGF
jgi:hypothetical protein